MKQEIINILKTKIQDDSYKYSVVTTILFGGISYIYLAVNNIHNYDNIFCTPKGMATHLDWDAG